MPSIKIKFCGFTTLEDATLAASLGADFVGFNFCKDSPRKVSAKHAQDIISKLPPFVSAVGVFVDEEIGVTAKTAKKCGLKSIQLHGSESPAYCSELAQLTSLPIIKAFRIADQASLEMIPQYKDVVTYFLLDTFIPGEPGGTGETFNWDLALKVKELNKPFFLAGGLTPENIEEAIEKVQPFGIDTASGIERGPKRKDYDKMRQFISRARGI